MLNISLVGFSVLYESLLYDIDDVKFIGVDSEKFSSFISQVKTYREICKDYVKNISISDCNLEKLSSIGILKTEVKKDYMKIVFFDKEENWKYTLMISNSGYIHSPSSKDPKVLILKLLQPILRRELVVEVDREYTKLVPVEVLFCESQYLKIHEYTNHRLDTDEVKFGVEFEINSAKAWEDDLFKRTLNYLMKKYPLIFEEDLSIEFIEVKTEPMNYQDIMKVVQDLQLLRDLFPQHFSNKFAGFHVHFSKIHKDSENRAKRVRKFISENISYDDYCNLFGRYPNDYSELKTDDENSRYQFINTNSYKTIEVRGATTKMTCDLIKVLKFAKDLSDIVNSNIDIEYSVKSLIGYFRDMALA